MSKTQKSKPTSAVDIARAEELIQQAEQVETEKCSAEIEAVLRKYNRTIIPQITQRGMQTIPQIVIVPVTKNTPPLSRIQSLEEEEKQE